MGAPGIAEAAVDALLEITVREAVR